MLFYAYTACKPDNSHADWFLISSGFIAISSVTVFVMLFAPVSPIHVHVNRPTILIFIKITRNLVFS